MKTPTERAAEAIAVEPNPSDRTEIARARLGCAHEIGHTRSAIRNLASGELSDDALNLLDLATTRLRALRRRVIELDAMAKAAQPINNHGDMPWPA